MDAPLYRAAEHIAAKNNAETDWRKQLYGWATEPPEGRLLAHFMWRGLLALAALLFGVGLIFWLASNWQGLSRGTKLGLIETAVGVLLAIACIWRRVRNASLLGAMLALGGLLAFIGQTYQTGADAWQLFAAWAGLSLLWVLMARSDLLWASWIVIAALALALWTGPLGLFGWLDSAEQPDEMVVLTMVAWLVLALIPIGVSIWPKLRLLQGLGRWSYRLALGLALSAWVALGVSGLFLSRDHMSIAWPMAAVLVACVMWGSLRGPWRDLHGLALSLLAANVLLMALATRVLFESGFEVGGLLLLGLLGLACLGASATWLLRLQQTWSGGSAR